MILSLINNISLLLALSMCYSVILRRWKPDTKAYPVASGILLGLITIAGMMNPFVFAEGIIIDGRTFIACIAGILGGPVSAVLVVLIGGGYRIWSIGGVGVLSGIGYLCTSAALGVLYRYWKRDKPEFFHPLHLYGLGLVVSASMMGWMFALPSPQSWHALNTLLYPVMILFPLCTVVLVKLLERQIQSVSLIDALEESEAWRKTILHSAMDGFWLADAQGHLLEVNEAYCRMSGYSTQDLRTMRIADLEAGQTNFGESMFTPKENETRGHRFETKHRRKDGSVFDVEMSVQYQSIRGGCWVVFLKDITEPKQVERLLNKRNRIYKTLLDVCHDGIAIINQDHQVIEANGKFSTMLGYNPDEVLSLHTWDWEVVMPEEEIRKEFAQLSKIQCTFESVHRRKDGTFYDVEVSASGAWVADEALVMVICRDVTQRKRNEEKIKYQSGLITSLIDSIPDLIFYKDLQGVYLGCNTEFACYVGLQKDEIIGKTDYDLFSQEEAEAYRINDLSALEWKSPHHNEEWIRYPDGKTVCLDTLKTPFLNSDGDLIGTLGVCRDITSRKRAEEQLIHVKNLLHYVISHALGSIAIFDRGMHTIYVSDRFLREYNVTGKDKIASHSSDVFANLPQKWKDSYQRVLVGEICSHDEEPFVRVDGSVDWIRWECRPWFESDGSIGGMILYAEVITERKRMENELRESEMKFRAIFEQASDPIWLVDLETTHFAEFNDRAYRSLGYSRQEFSRLNVSDVEALDSPQDIRLRIETLLKEGSLYFETKHRDSEGNVRDVVVSASVVDIQAKKYTLAIVHDITEQKRAEKEIQRFTQLLESIRSIQTLFIQGADNRSVFDAFLKTLVELTNSEYGFLDEVLWDDQGAMYKLSLALSDISWDEASKHLYGELVNRNLEFRNLHNLAGCPAVESALTIANDISHDPRSGGIPKGHPLIRAFMGVPIYFGDKLVGVAGVANRPGGYDEEIARFLEPFFSTCSSIIYAVRTNENEKRMTAALRASEEKYRHLFESAPIGIFRTSSKGRVLSLNQTMAHMVGFESTDEAVQYYTELGTQLYVDSARRDEFLKMLQNNRSVKNFEYEAITADGRRIWVEMNARMQENEGDEPFVIEGFTTDITSRKQAEAEKDKLQSQFLQIQKMEALGTLAGGIAHDFNNILAGIMGFTELTMKQLEPEREDLHENLKIVFSSTQRAKNLVKQILAFSRKKELEKTIFYPAALVKECLQLLRSTIPSTIEIKQHCYAPTQRILGDPTQIHQIVMNLGTNAAHAMMEKGGVLTVSFTEEALDASVPLLPYFEAIPGNYVCLLMKDTGEGIPLEIQNRVFDPFFTTKDKTAGTGLGLSVVLGIVKSHNGAMAMESALGQGTTFKVYLPIHEESVAPLKSADDVCKGKGERILLVDDEEMLIQLGTRMLRSLGYEVISCLGSEEALKLFGANPNHFDLVLTDQTMPKMKGTQLAQEIKKIRPDIPIILNTGFDERLQEDQLHEAGISEMMMKPYTIHDLSYVISKYCQT